MLRNCIGHPSQFRWSSGTVCLKPDDDFENPSGYQGDVIYVLEEPMLSYLAPLSLGFLFFYSQQAQEHCRYLCKAEGTCLQ